jgi:hypothetical protein
MNNLVPMPPAGTMQGSWIWDGSSWVCNPDCAPPQPPPFGPPVFSGPTQQPPWYPGANGGVSFGATAPPNPVRGHMWWDGATFWLFDGAAWTPIGGTGSGGGAATGTNPPSNPFPGQQWFNGSTLFIWDGNAWVPTSTTKSSVQATAPPNPNPGDLWFDGQVQRIWSGSAWVTVGPGATVGPIGTTTKVLSILQSTAISLGTANTWAVVPLTGTPSVDINVAFDTTTRRITPSVAGIYLWVVRAYLATGAAVGSLGVAMALNDPGGTMSALFQLPAVSAMYGQPTGISDWISAVGLCHMNGSTDYVRFWAVSGDANFPASAYSNVEGYLLP